VSNINSSETLYQLAVLRHTFWLQNFTFTAAQAAQHSALRQARWARVRQLAD